MVQATVTPYGLTQTVKGKKRRVRDLQYHPTAQTRLAELNALRKKHGFFGTAGSTARPSALSKELLERGLENGYAHLIPPQLSPEEQEADENAGTWRPKNIRTWEAIAHKFEFLGFTFTVQVITDRNGREHRGVQFVNYPTIGGLAPTLADLILMPPELADGTEDLKIVEIFREQHGATIDFTENFERMDQTGTGYKGMEGASWLPCHEPFKLDDRDKTNLQDLAEALFHLNDAAQALFGIDRELTELLTHKCPQHIPQLVGPGKVSIIRPDVVIVNHQGERRFVCTELESCPAGEGMIYASTEGYNLPPAMVDSFIQFLDGRRYIVLGTSEWAEYVWEQTAFIKALRDRGVDAQFVFDKDLKDVHEQARHWSPPKEAPDAVKKAWNPDLIGRLQKLGFDEFVTGYGQLPKDLADDAVVKRFGYFDNFVHTTALDALQAWQDRGAQLANPLQFYLESKSLMAAIALKAVREWISQRSPTAVAVLDRCVATTRVLGFNADDQDLIDHKNFWLTKYAAWDGNNESWGSRSLHMGSESTPEAWRRTLQTRREYGHPVVAQHVINSARYTPVTVARDGTWKHHFESRTRLTPFFLRDPNDNVIVADSMITLRPNTFRIHGATDAAEAPVIFR